MSLTDNDIVTHKQKTLKNVGDTTGKFYLTKP